MPRGCGTRGRRVVGLPGAGGRSRRGRQRSAAVLSPGAFDLDYHPDASRGGATLRLDEPPRDGTRGGALRAWLGTRSRRACARVAANRLTTSARRDRAVSQPRRVPGLYDLRGIQRAIGGPVGIDAYTPRAEFRELRHRAIAAAGNAAPIPIAFEVGIGFFPWFPPLDAGDDPNRERDHLLSLLAAGLRGFNLFMAVERDRYYGAAIYSRARAPRCVDPYADGHARRGRLAGLRRAVAIAVVDIRADARFGQATCATIR